LKNCVDLENKEQILDFMWQALNGEILTENCLSLILDMKVSFKTNFFPLNR
jgi:hypothetical protein